MTQVVDILERSITMNGWKIRDLFKLYKKFYYEKITFIIDHNK